MKTVEVSIKDLSFAVIRYWWIVMLCGVLGLGLVYVKNQREVPVVNSEDSATYQERLLAFEKQYKIYENSLKQMEVSLKPYETINDQSMNYLNNSVLIRIDPFNAEKAFIDISVNTDEQGDNPGNIILYYLDLINKMPLRNVLGDVYPSSLQENVVKEIITAKQISENILSIQCYSIEEPTIEAKQIVFEIFEYIKNSPIPFKNVSLNILNSGTLKTIDYDLDLYKSQRIFNISKYYDEFIRRSNTTSQQREVYRAYGKTKPVEPSPSISGAPNNSLSRLLVGTLIGVFLGCLVVILLYFIKIPIYSRDQVKKQLKIRFLGEVRNLQAGKNFEEEPYRIIIANLNNQVEEYQNIILVGKQTSINTINLIVDRLNKYGTEKKLSFVSGDDVFTSSKTIENLSSARNAILVVKRDASTIREINKEVEKIIDTSAKVRGYIFVK